nr:TIGR03857 family LLM class F420-dependent oxidoreductase [Parafrankia discariae]
MTELGCYAHAGHSSTPRDLIDEVRGAERLALGATFVSERFSTKDAATLVGAAGAVSESIGITTGATNHNTRHPIVTATFASTAHRLTGGRFALGLGRGFDRLFTALGLTPVTGAQIEDFVGLMRRLWRGEMVLGHDGPAGAYPYLHQDADFDEDIPVMLAALGPRSLELAGRCMDGVILHTFFSDAAVAAALEAVARGAKAAGRDPAEVRVWSVLATVSTRFPRTSGYSGPSGGSAPTRRGATSWSGSTAGTRRCSPGSGPTRWSGRSRAGSTPRRRGRSLSTSPRSSHRSGWRPARPAVPSGAPPPSRPSSTSG